MSDDLVERLRDHARSFDGLLSLIPAKLYYGEDVSDQWKRKKQTPEQKKAAKTAKLDPDNWKSAKDVMDERSAAAKRKRSEDQNKNDNESDIATTREEPKSVQDQLNHAAKKRKLDNTDLSQNKKVTLSTDEKKLKKAEKKAAQKEKTQKEKEKQQRQKARKQAEKAQRDQEAAVRNDGTALAEPVLLDRTEEADQWSTASSSEGIPAILSPPADSASSSISSIIDQPVKATLSKNKQHIQSQLASSEQIPASETEPIRSQIKQPSASREKARERLAEAISSFRTARKADAPSSKRPRNRAELLEQRRQKEETKRQAKKELRRKEREEAARKEDEEIARRFSPGGSGSLLASPRSPPLKDGENHNNFSYGRIEFGDGSKVDATRLEGLLEHRKQKGPQDAQTALKAAQSKANRLGGLDEQKRKEIEEKDMWLNAKRRAHGDRVRDDTSLLKKALKRQEGQKKKSEKEWTDRKDGVQKAQEVRQKKRTENLAKRKEDKLAHKVGKKRKTIKKRPGFEGSFRGRTGGKKKP